MLKIKSVKVEGFWDRGEVNCDFNEDINIIIGRNGTGKTTLMNILHSVLTCDLVGLAESTFDKVTISLHSETQNKQITVFKKDGEKSRSRFEEVTYVIDGTEYSVPLLPPMEHRVPYRMTRLRIEERISGLKKVLDSLLNISSISVYRLRHDEDYEIRDKFGTRLTAPVDYRVESVLNDLSHYCAELGVKEQSIARQLQKDVLTSILYSSEETRKNLNINEFDRAKEEEELIRAYVKLRAFDEDVSHKIKAHTKAIEKTIKGILDKNEKTDINPIESWFKTRKIIELSLEADQKIDKANKQLNLFLNKLKEFMPEKCFRIESGKIIVENKFGEISINKLSSGEKQLIILLIESLLQRYPSGKHPLTKPALRA